MQGSVPTLTEFDPRIIPFQWTVIQDVRSNFDYEGGPHELLLSGSVGSAKSLLMAHLLLTHCLMYPNAKGLIGRKAMPDLRASIFQMVLDHLDGSLEHGVHYKAMTSSPKIVFANGSTIIGRSWSDKRYKKFRSLEVTAAAVEELTENNEEQSEAYKELSMRVGRSQHVPERWIVSATNPDSPSHWAYKYFIESKHERRHVYYSKTHENPFLPKSYVEHLEKSLDAKMAKRMLFGEWIEIAKESIYYAYQEERNFVALPWKIRADLPIVLSFDFNIGHGKPMSALALQQTGTQIHAFREFIIEGADTNDMMDEIIGSGILDKTTKVIICGDASGKAKDTRSKRSDYDIILNKLKHHFAIENRRVFIDYQVPLSNPAIRRRHNMVNAACRNGLGEVNLFVHFPCKGLNDGLKYTKLREGSDIIEDDSYKYQHVTTALGYAIVRLLGSQSETRETNMWGTQWKF